MPRPIPTSAFSQDPTEPSRWLWTDRIPLEAITSIQGDGAAGKSTFTRWLAARVSRGELPGDLDGAANVLWLNIEEHARRDIRPGLDRQGADVARIFRPTDRAPIVRLPRHLDRLHDTVIARNARLVVIDQVNGFFATGREDSIRAAMTGLRELAEDCECAILLTRNLNGNRGADAYRRGRGGGLIVDISRAAFHLGLHPDDGGNPDGRRVLASVKGNICGRTSRALVIGIDVGGRVVIGEEVDLGPNTLLARRQESREERPEQLELAVAFLREILDGREVPTIEVEMAAVERGISPRTISRARAQVGVLHRRVSNRNPDGSTTQQTLLRRPDFAVPNDAAPAPAPPPLPACPSRVAPITAPTHADDSTTRFSLLELDDSVGRLGGLDNPTPINGEPTTLPSRPDDRDGGPQGTR